MKMATYKRRKGDKRNKRTPLALEIVVFSLSVAAILIMSGVL